MSGAGSVCARSGVVRESGGGAKVDGAERARGSPQSDLVLPPRKAKPRLRRPRCARSACFDVAVAMRCIPDPGPDVRQRPDHVIGTLVNLTR